MSAHRRSSVRIRIDRLRVPYDSASQRERVAAALTQELATLFSAQPDSTIAPHHRQTLRQSSWRAMRPLSPEHLGKKIARLIYRQVNHGETP